MFPEYSWDTLFGLVNPRLGYSCLQVVFCVNLGTFLKCFLRLGRRLTGVRSTLFECSLNWAERSLNWAERSLNWAERSLNWAERSLNWAERSLNWAECSLNWAERSLNWAECSLNWAERSLNWAECSLQVETLEQDTELLRHQLATAKTSLASFQDQAGKSTRERDHLAGLAPKVGELQTTLKEMHEKLASQSVESSGLRAEVARLESQLDHASARATWQADIVVLREKELAAAAQQVGRAWCRVSSCVGLQ
jgi:chromosome segregation ATPase